MPQTHTGGGFSVTIGDDGAVLVQAGDSISKYSMAIHGDFHHLQEYRRKIGGSLKPLVNINVISAGETLYHAPSVPEASTTETTVQDDDPFPRLPSGAYDIQQILIDNNIPLAYRDKLTWLMNSGRGLQATITFVGVFAAPGAIGAGLAFTNAVAGPLLGIMAGCYGIWKARNFGIQTVGLRGTVYGSVAWAFGHQAPVLPREMETLINAGNGARDLENYRFMFEAAAAKSMNEMSNYARRQGLSESDLKIAAQAFGKGSPQQLAAAMMVDIADYYYSGNQNNRTAFLQPWSWYPHDRYSGRPNYNDDVSKRYGWG